MNDFDYPGSGPCDDYEFDIAELLDGALAPERARIVSLHLTSCVRCRAWRDRYAAVDRQLSEALVAPPLSADFASRLQGRVAAETCVINGNRREAIEHEYSHELELLQRGWKIPAVLNGIAAAAVSGCLYVAWRSYSIEYDVNFVLGGPSWLTAYSLVSVLAAGGALVWSFRSDSSIRRLWR